MKFFYFTYQCLVRARSYEIRDLFPRLVKLELQVTSNGIEREGYNNGERKVLSFIVVKYAKKRKKKRKKRKEKIAQRVQKFNYVYTERRSGKK